MTVGSLFGQQKAQMAEVTLYYRYDKYNLDATYLSNREAFAELDRLVELYRHNIDSVVVVAYASPEGTVAYNQRLSERRAATMKNYLLDTYPDVDFVDMRVHPNGEDFDGLIRMVEADKKMPHKKEALKILRASGVSADQKIRNLIKLRGGYPYSYIKKHILPYLRTAATFFFYYTPTTAAPIALAAIEAPLLPPPHSAILHTPKHTPKEEISEPTAQQPPLPATKEPQEPEEQPQVQQPAEPSHRYMALKTNLLFDAIGAVNVGLEWPIGQRYSLDLSWICPWWLDKEWDWCYQLLWGEVEGRYWLGDRTKRDQLHGHFVGLYAGGGLYDFQWRAEDGYQGEFFLAAGLSYGIAMPLGKSWNMELEVGFGYLQSDYRHYYHITTPAGEEVLIRDRISGRFGYWGPTKARISLVRPIRWGK